MGDPPGDTAIYPVGLPDAIITADCIKLTVDSSVADPRFVGYVIESPLYRERLQEIIAGVAQQKISLARFRKFPLQLAPRDEQDEIVRRVESLFAYAHRLESHYIAARTEVEHLTPALLAKAFLGELVPQEASDEPAAILLERIRAQRTVPATVAISHEVVRLAKEVTVIMEKLRDVLALATDWLPVAEVFRRCGVSDGTSTDRLEELYSELRQLDKAGILKVRRIGDFDELKLEPKA
jgi:hypothetical protein